MKSCFWILFFATFALRALPQEGFDLSDAFGDDDNPAPTKRPEKPKSGGGGSAGDFDLFDAFGPDPTPRPPAKDPKKPAGGGFDLNDAFGPDPETQKPKVVVPKDGGTGGGSFGDSDLEDIGNDGSYKPDPGRGGGGGGGGGGADEPQDLALLWAQFLKQLSANVPESFHDWINNLKQVVVPLLERVMKLLDVTQ
ncbi:CD99 molecule isoform X4 [Scleropages formosus]|uniref:CD99 molecule isoform X4 n=1 Tax=Scleropages formosus TaxID=113540 RepID=UPI0010FABD9C|nr:CD99 antigen-like protein 2 isoform X4 [Scleropages formosus]